MAKIESFSRNSRCERKFPFTTKKNIFSKAIRSKSLKIAQELMPF